MASSLWQGWCLRAAKATKEVCPGLSWGQDQLTVATDCSGSGSPEAALRALEAAVGLRLCRLLYACDITPASQRWLQSAFVHQHLLPDMRKRKFSGTGMHTSDVDGMPVFVPKGQVDVYVCGFPCQPFSTKGQQLQFEDDNVQPFFAMARTVACLRPRIVVAENVMGLRSHGALAQVKEVLAKINGYQVIVLDGLSNHHFGLPQHRPRIYILMLRIDAVQPDAGLIIRKIVSRCQETGTASTPSWPSWLESAGLPMVPMKPKAPVAPEAPCTCNFHTTCKLHKCSCGECQPSGAKRHACKWRKSMKKAVRKPTYRAAASNMLRRWRVVRNDGQLKKSPGYFELAGSRGLTV